MKEFKDGGPAFPMPDGDFALRDSSGRVAEANGMTLRDYFAAHALKEIIGSEKYSDHTQKEKAESAYKFADAMLEARQK